MKSKINKKALPEWPSSKLGEAIEILAQKAGFPLTPANISVSPDNLDHADDNTIDEWIGFVSERLSLEAEPVESPYSDIGHMVRGAGPAIFRVPGPGARFLILLKGGRRTVSLIGPDLSIHSFDPEVVRGVLAHELESPLIGYIDQLMENAGVAEHRRHRARKAILREQLNTARVRGCWLLRLAPDAPVLTQLRHARLLRYLLATLCLYIIGQLFILTNWWIVGKGVFQGAFEWAWLLAWALLLFTIIPFNLLEMWVQSLMSIGAGTVFKKRLLYGAMKLNPEETRLQGAGQFLGRVMESESLNALVLQGGFTAVFAIIQLFMALGVLSMGTGGWFHTLPLFAWMLVTFIVCWRYYLYNRKWRKSYRKMTNDLVERMVGHRTRLAQEDQEHWHTEEDQYLEHYLNLSEKMDQIGIYLNAFISRGWMIVGLGGIAYVFVSTPESRVKLAVSLGGIMLASQALSTFVAGFMSVVGVKMAWEQAGPIFRAAARPRESASVISSDLDMSSDDRRQPILLAQDIIFRYREHGRPVLRECRLKIHKGDRMLLEGPSGGGKSTLAAILAGLRVPESGLLLLQGVDRHTIGADEWRKRVVAAPQFHENHIFTETFSFNLLMGRRWPPLPEDIETAETLCRELGLGNLLDQMPAGFQQMIGESGWQLSHGERSRLYIARALLQRADVIILDESFAALDPENLHLALRCVLNRAPALVVIAHP